MNELQLRATMWMNITNIILSERSQTQTKKNTLYDFIHIKLKNENHFGSQDSSYHWRGGYGLKRGTRWDSGMWIMFCFLIWVLVTQVCLFCEKFSNCTLMIYSPLFVSVL